MLLIKKKAKTISVKTLPFSKIEYEQDNERFSRVKIFVAYEGENQNRSFISREVLEKAAKTIHRVPIVGKYNKDIEDFEGHGTYIKLTEDGIETGKETVPYGFVDSDAVVSWERQVDPDDVVREYLTVEGVLWTSEYPEAKRVLEGKNNHSMEIGINESEYDEKDILNIKDAYFKALCILGEDTSPCFEGSKIISQKETPSVFSEMYSKMLHEYSLFEKKKGESDSMNYENEEIVEIEESINLQIEPEASEEDLEVQPEVVEVQPEVVEEEVVLEVEPEVIEEEEEVQPEEVQPEVVEVQQTPEIDYSVLAGEVASLREEVASLRAENERFRMAEKETAMAELRGKYSTHLSSEVVEEILSRDFSIEQMDKELGYKFALSVMEQSKNPQREANFSMAGARSESKIGTKNKYAL